MFGENGIIKKAEEVAEATKNSIDKEQEEVDKLLEQLNSTQNEISEGIVVTPDNDVTIVTSYGKIDIIWLKDGTNEVAENPNEPNLYNDELKPVTWTKNGTIWTEDTVANSNWYEYIKIDGTEDNITSRWANAKNSDGSYFVWIPRYAYRITYYENATSTEPTGYYDGNGMWRATDKKLKCALENGIQTVDGKQIEMSLREYELLKYLLDNENIALSRDKILNNVWNYDYYGDSRTIDSHIKKIRHKLGKKGKYIQTMRGVGYKFEVKK